MKRLASLAALCLALGPAVVQAHHSFAAQYDSNKPVTLEGTITKVEWMNPHAYFYVDVADDKGKDGELGGRRRRAERALSRGMETDLTQGRRQGDHHRLACEKRLEPDQRHLVQAAGRPLRVRGYVGTRWHRHTKLHGRTTMMRRPFLGLGRDRPVSVNHSRRHSGRGIRLPGFRGCQTARQTSLLPRRRRPTGNLTSPGSGRRRARCSTSRRR